MGNPRASLAQSRSAGVILTGFGLGAEERTTGGDEQAAGAAEDGDDSFHCFPFH